MAYKRSKKKSQTNAAAYIAIAAGLVLLIVLIAIIAANLGGKPSQQATASPTAGTTPMPTYSADIIYTAPPADTSSADITQEPTSSALQQQNLSVPQDKLFCIHLTVDSGELLESEPVFDESYMILTDDETDYTDVRLLVFLTDYNGNSQVYRFDTTDITIRLKSFLLPGGDSPVAIDELSELSIRVDAAQNLHLTWIGNTIRIDGEGTGQNSISAQIYDHMITVSARPLGLFDKADYQR